jgi:Tol biopolymer transport system component
MTKLFFTLILSLSIFFSAENPPLVKITKFRTTGLDCSWDPDGSDKIVYSMKGKDGFYDLYLSDMNGTFDTCLTANSKILPNKHICCPSWFPNGKWIVFLAEKEKHDGSSTDALPGFGAYCDIWMMSADAKKIYKLVDIPNDYDHGVILPKISPDGKHIEWTNRVVRPKIMNPKQQAGYWSINYADFDFGKDSIPEVKNVRVYQPGDTCFHECYGFSPDGNKLVFCSDYKTNNFLLENIFTIDTDGKNLTQLTDGDYNEHSVYTPDGKHIVWMSNKDNKNHGTDWWMMNADGTNKVRLTYFNDKKNSMYAGKAIWTGLVSFSPDGKKFIGGVQKSLITQEGYIVMGEFLR